MHPPHKHLRLRRLAPSLLALALIAGPAAPERTDPSVSATPGGLTFELGIAHAGAVLVVHGSRGMVWSGSFAAGEPLFYSLVSDDGAGLSDGQYIYEIRLFGPKRTEPTSLDTADEGPRVIARLSGVFKMSLGVPEPLAPPTAADFAIEDGVPEIRLVDTNAGEQVWDVRSLADNFEIVDQTPLAGATIPFEIENAAPTGSIYVGSSNRIGLHRISPPGHPLHVGSNDTNGNEAHVTVGGVWTNGSSRDSKESIRPLTRDEAVAAVAALEPVKFVYKADPGNLFTGFIAEDVPELVATPDRKTLSSMDIVAVLTRVVQVQQEAILDLSERLAALEADGGPQR